MRFGSVCSGIEAASVAWSSLGWSAAWFAEIAPFPSKALAHRHPAVTNVGSLEGLTTRLVGTHGSRGWSSDTERMTFVPEAARCLTTSAQRIDTETETFVTTCFDPTQVTSHTNRSNCNGDTAALAVKGRPPHIAFNARQDPISGPISGIAKVDALLEAP